MKTYLCAENYTKINTKVRTEAACAAAGPQGQSDAWAESPGCSLNPQGGLRTSGSQGLRLDQD